MRAFKQQILIYYIDTNEIPGELSGKNMISSHEKITCDLHMWKDHCCYGYMKNKWNGLVFHWCLCTKKNITWPLGDTKLLLSCWKIFHLFPSLTHEIFCNTQKRNFVSLCSYIISSIPTDMEKRSLVVTLHSLYCVLNLMFTVISSHDQCDEQTRPDLS